jgi:hypothetical protein
MPFVVVVVIERTAVAVTPIAEAAHQYDPLKEWR